MSRVGPGAALRVRDRLLPMPGRADGYRSVLMLGTTGAGKTTLVRQLLGTNPRTERFPPTSTAKTTIAETELICMPDGPFRAAITFASLDEVIQHLEENVVAAALGVLHERHQYEIVLRLLDHVDQRFRFSYVLGSPTTLLAQLGGDTDDDDDDTEDDEPADPIAQRLQASTAGVVDECVRLLRNEVDNYARHARAALSATPDLDEAAVAEALDTGLESVLHEREVTASIIDALVEEIRLRFDAFDVGQVKWAEHDWPSHWTWDTDDRDDFLAVLGRFTGNHANSFGRLLTPLVNGIRVSAPFRPTWSDAPLNLVLIDGEGLGHVPGSIAAVSTFLSRRLDRVDAIALVDNAVQPMQAAPIAALKAIAVSGNAPKLVYVSTHFDMVRGDNIPTVSSREQHVFASVENVLNAIREDLGPAGERQLRQRFDTEKFFVGSLQEQLSEEKKSGRNTLKQLRSLLEALQTIAEVPHSERRGPQPVFDRAALTAAVLDATQSFHTRWRASLGLQQDPDIPKQHWSRIKALTRRVAGGEDEYQELKPAGELRYELQSRIFRMLQEPIGWSDGELDESEREELLLDATHLLTDELIELTSSRVLDERRAEWQSASDQHGTGSTLVRARIVEDDIFEPAAPTVDPALDGDTNDFVSAVTTVVADVGRSVGFVLR